MRLAGVSSAREPHAAKDFFESAKPHRSLTRQDASMEWIRRQKFRALLFALIVVVLIYPIFQDLTTTRIVFDVLRTIFFILALFIIFDAKRQRILAFVIGVPTILVGWTYAIVSDPPPMLLDVVFHSLATVFFAITVYTILHAVYRDDDVTSDSVYGAFCSYLLVGVVFGHLYCIFEASAPGSFRTADPATAALFALDRGHYILSYFSLMTITTVGYGDITPATAPTRALAVIEAVVGQFYIAVLVAELIGKRVSQSVANRHSQDPGA